MQRICFWGVVFAAVMSLTGCKEEAAPAPQNVRVTYLVTRADRVPLVTELPGRVSAYMVSEVRPQVSGIIQKRLFEEGSDVKEGQQLYQIDPSLFQAAYNSAKAELAKAKANVVAARLLAERYSKIVGIKAVSKQEYDDAVAARDQAVAAVDATAQAVETARINLEYTKVLSPVSGRISRSFVTPGALVTQNQPDPLSTVQQLTPVYVDVTQSSTELLKLRRELAAGQIQAGANRGAKIKLKLEDGSPYVRIAGSGEAGAEPEWVLGELQFSDVTIEQNTGVVSVRATFDNPDTILLPGMYVRAVIEEGVREGAIMAPQKAVMRDMKNRTLVYVLT
ncbi:MAG: efflux RND transporter periplasmic adaptor subunit, partial [Burkholderiaceae bacterium]|nr:efflux RND transporter periplasmic adaptor subunit [Burkholderiaceae bacterium]